jgi:hypothetical protein
VSSSWLRKLRVLRGVTLVMNSGGPTAMYGCSRPHGASAVLSSGNRSMRSTEIAVVWISKRPMPPLPVPQPPGKKQPRSCSDDWPLMSG